MSLMRDDLRTWLLSQATVTAYTSNIYIMLAPDDFQEDYIRLWKVAPGNNPDSYGDLKFNDEVWQIDVYSLNPDTPDKIGAVIVDLLNRLQGTMGGQAIAFSECNGPVCISDPSDPMWTHGVIEWRVKYRR